MSRSIAGAGPRRPARVRRLFAFALALAWIATPGLVSADEPEAPRDLSGMGLEDLMNLEITSASKHEQRIAEVPSAIAVLDAETIRRSGATSIPEALRLVPGLIVQRIDGNKWAVASRGFAYRWANSLLVLVDGRSVYSPMFSGVYWDAQDVVLEDVDRIEVIRGPGATVWGANAVTGVINILTKHAGETHGVLASATTGEREPFIGTLRWGGTPARGLDVRAFVRGTDRRASDRSRVVGALSHTIPLAVDDLVPGDDRSRMVHGGVRADWQPTERDGLTFQGDTYVGWSDMTTPVPDLDPPYMQLHLEHTRIRNGYGLARWRRDLRGGGELAVQAYLDHVDRPDTLFTDHSTTADVDVQHHLWFGERNEVVWGGGVRWIRDRLQPGSLYGMNPETSERVLWSLFAQDEMTLVPARVRLTVGSKFERHAFTGLEVQPTARLLWTPSLHQSAWASWSRAVRAPTRGDRDAALEAAVTPGPGVPVLVLLAGGGSAFDSEVLNAWEVGWRATPARKVSLDAAAFYNQHTRMRASATDGVPSLEPAPQPHLLAVQRLINGFDVDARGIEVSATFNPRPAVLLQTAGTWYTSKYRIAPGQPSDLGVTGDAGTSPAFQALVRIAVDLPRQAQLDLIGRHVGELPSGFVPAYETLDLRAGWRPSPALAVDFVARDLFESGRFESNYPGSLVVPTVARRSLEARITLRTR